MSQNDVVAKFNNQKQKIESLFNRNQQGKGKIEGLTKQLKDLGLDSIEDAEQWIQESEQELKKLITKSNTLNENVEKLLQSCEV